MNSKMSKNALTLIAAASLSACVNLAPAHERPALPVADAVGAAEASAALPNWQGFYADARLRALIEVALKNNRDLRVALANVEQAAALARVGEANRWPTVGAGAIATRAPDSKGEKINSSFQVGLQITAYELDLWSRLRNQGEAAQARYLASAEGARAARLALIAAVAGSHYALQVDEQVLDLARRTAVGRAESLRLTKLRFDQGAASSLELQGAISSLEATRAALAQAERQRAQDENALVLLLGQPLGADLPAAAPLADQTLAPLAAGVRSEALLERPDVRQAEAQLVAAEANIGAARAAFFPSILLSTSAGTASSQLSELFKQSAWSFTGQLLAPIFDAGRNRANLEGAKAARDAAIAQYDKSVQQAFREVADALVARSTLTEQLRAQQAQADAEAERLRLVELRFANGASSQLELLDAQRASFAAQQAALQVKLANLQAGVGLYRALGGGI